MSFQNLPKYIRFGNDDDKEGYHELLNLILTTWFNINGFYLPPLTNAQATLVFAANPSPGTMWYNSDLDKIQFAGASAIQTITSV